MTDFGRFVLLLAVFLSSYAILIDILAAWKKDAVLASSGRNATIGTLICLTSAVIALWVLLLNNDFSVDYVAGHSSRALPVLYKISALWAGAAGSLLLWLWIQVGFVCMVFYKTRSGTLAFCARARSIANLVCVFFLLVLVFDKQPFTTSVVAPADGGGLNPLLQHPAMVLHPPILFIGYAAFIIPFAWAFGYLKCDPNTYTNTMLSKARNWTLWAWLFLTGGIVLGAWWAYEELGWGGYWAWDPVENSSIMPWFIATAMLHCFRFYSPKGPMAMWTVMMSILTYSLCVFGTFLTRYGLVSSVHAFPDPGLGILFMVLIIHIWLIAAIMILSRHFKKDKSLKSEPARPHKFVILTNWLMLLLLVVVFVGTLFPFLSGLVTDEKISLKPDYFNKITAPEGLLLLFFIGLCPHLVKFGFKKCFRTILACIAVAVSIVVWFITKQIAAVYFVACGFVLICLTTDVIAYEKSLRSADSMLKRSLRWYGARAVHFGILLIFIGIAGSGGYDLDQSFVLVQGDKMTVDKYEITFDELTVEHGPNFTNIVADLSVRKDGELITKLKPAKAYYSASDKNTSEVSIRRTLGGDLYTAVTQVDNASKTINLRVLIKPLINWIWIGTFVLIIGCILVLIYFYSRTPASASVEKEAMS